jgi:peptidoglycan/xylan/chitin deacetylase (PgdA/CDA1 family)
MYLSKTPKLLKAIYPDLTWDIPTQKGVVYLTFDDGPIPEVTPYVLKVLAQYQIKATFFCIGDNVQKHPEVFAEIIKAGHAIGNHTFNHLNGWKTDKNIYQQNTLACETYFKTNLFRPPYGRIKRSQIKMLQEKFKIVMYDVLSGDFDQKSSPDKCYQNVLNHTNDGAIIVFHDSEKAKKNVLAVLPLLLQNLKQQGYAMESIPY